MKIFVKNVPSSTTDRALREFAEQVISPRWYTPFAVKGKVTSCVVLKIRDLNTESIEFHGLLDIQPFKAAQLAIDHMNRQKFNGQYVEARKWHIRSYLADRRDQYKNNSQDLAGERRFTDRRRPNLVMDTYVHIRVEAVKGFNREYDR